MEVLIVAVGKTRKGPEQALVERYRERTRWNVTVKEVSEQHHDSLEQRLAREGEAILKLVPKGAFVFALDSRGNQLESTEFAKKIANLADDGHATIAFVIGGPDGHDKAVIERADHLLSLGKMTWPHMVARAMLAEQIYRAWTIAARHPYHLGH